MRDTAELALCFGTAAYQLDQWFSHDVYLSHRAENGKSPPAALWDYLCVSAKATLEE